MSEENDAGSIRSVVRLETKDLQRDVANVKTELDKVTGSAKKAGTEGSKGTNKLAHSAGGLKNSLLAAGAAIAGLFIAINKLTDAALVQAKADLNMASALRQAGDSSKETYNEFKKFTAELQKATGVGDEVSQNMIKMGLNMGIPISQIKSATQGAVGLAEALDLDVKSAMKMISRGVKGDFSMLERYSAELRNAGTQAEKTAIFQTLLANGYKQSTDVMQSKIGALKDAKNAFGDAKEVMGDVLITALQPIAKSVTILSEGFQRLPSGLRTVGVAIGVLIPLFFALNAAMGTVGLVLGAIGVGILGAGIAVDKFRENIKREELEFLESADKQIEAVEKLATQRKNVFERDMKRKKDLSEIEKKLNKEMLDAEAKMAQANKENNKRLFEEENKRWVAASEARQKAMFELKGIEGAEERRAELLEESEEELIKLQERKEELRKKYSQEGLEFTGIDMELEKTKEQLDLLSELKLKKEELGKNEEQLALLAIGRERERALVIAAGNKEITQAVNEYYNELQKISMLDFTKKRIEELDGYKQKILDLTRTESEIILNSIDMERAKVLATIDGNEEMIEAVNRYYDLLKDKTAFDIQKANAMGTAQAIQGAFRNLSSSIISYKQAEVQHRIDQEEEGSAKYKKLMLEQWKINQSASITETIMAGAQAAVQAYKALAGIPYVGPALGAAAAFAVGSMAAGKVSMIRQQQPPAFEYGGIVPGRSFTGDNVPARVNSGEMILTKEQQAELFNIAKGGQEGSNNFNIPININIGGENFGRLLAQKTESGEWQISQRAII